MMGSSLGQLFDVRTNTQFFCTLIEAAAIAVVVGSDMNISVGSNCASSGTIFRATRFFGR
jgi:hypothetical protein